jgi:hypothetical protein
LDTEEKFPISNLWKEKPVEQIEEAFVEAVTTWSNLKPDERDTFYAERDVCQVRADFMN